MSERDSPDHRSAGGEVDLLLVDDDEAWVTSTAQILERQREAFTVTTATTLSAASEAVAETDPDCVVCDYDLEAGTGLDLLADVREDGDRPFILITGQGDESVASDAIGQQVTDYIPKRSLGGRDDLLARRVEAAVESYRTRQALDRERRSKEAMLDILTATSSREGLAREFCTHLVRERGYACAWIGTLGQSRGVVPRAAAGEESYLDAAIEPGTTPEDGGEPALTALARGEPYVVPAVGDHADSGVDGWRTLAADHGFESAAAVPLVHEGTVLGVVAVYGTEPIDPGERDLLEEYGETIGYALQSAEWKESLLSTASVALDVELTDGSHPLLSLNRRLPEGSRLDVLTTLPREETLLYVVRADEATAAEVRDGAGEVGTVEEVAVTSDDPLQCEVTVSRPTPETVLANHGGRVVDVTVESGRAMVTAVSPDEDDVQSLVSAVHSTYPDAGVRSIRSTDPGRSATDGDPLGSLTDRQRHALELAYYNGYFERPREHNTTEIAEKLGVSRQTLTQHLRAGQRKLLSALLDPGEDPD